MLYNKNFFYFKNQKLKKIYVYGNRFYYSVNLNEQLDTYICYSPHSFLMWSEISAFCKKNNIRLTRSELSASLKVLGGKPRRILVYGKRTSVFYNIAFVSKRALEEKLSNAVLPANQKSNQEILPANQESNQEVSLSNEVEAIPPID
jgi:hypothetical protein